MRTLLQTSKYLIIFGGSGGVGEKTNSVIFSVDFFVTFFRRMVIYVRFFLFRNRLFRISSVGMRVTEQVCQVTSFGEGYRKYIRAINYFHSYFVKRLEL